MDFKLYSDISGNRFMVDPDSDIERSFYCKLVGEFPTFQDASCAEAALTPKPKTSLGQIYVVASEGSNGFYGKILYEDEYKSEVARKRSTLGTLGKFYFNPKSTSSIDEAKDYAQKFLGTKLEELERLFPKTKQ